MEKGFYKTPLGETMEVLDFDPINKMVYVPLVNGNFMWVHDTAYLTWTKEGQETVVPQETIEDEPKKKRTTKKKEI